MKIISDLECVLNKCGCNIEIKVIDSFVYDIYTIFLVEDILLPSSLIANNSLPVVHGNRRVNRIKFRTATINEYDNNPYNEDDMIEIIKTSSILFDYKKLDG